MLSRYIYYIIMGICAQFKKCIPPKKDVPLFQHTHGKAPEKKKSNLFKGRKTPVSPHIYIYIYVN